MSDSQKFVEALDELRHLTFAIGFMDEGSFTQATFVVDSADVFQRLVDAAKNVQIDYVPNARERNVIIDNVRSNNYAN